MQSEFEKLMEFRDAFDYEHDNDREIAIVGCAYIETIIKTTLEETFVADLKERDNILNESSGALSGIITRARLLYLLGVIPEIIFHDIKLVARIRNEFAHNVSASFESEKISTLCNKLKWHEFSMCMKAPPEATIREIYQVGVNQLVAHLNALPSLQRCKAKERN